MFGSSSPGPPAATGATPFVGREAELGELIGALERTLMGRGQVVLLAGEPGIGKTRLAEEIVGLSERRGARVLWGRCTEWEGAPPYWPWVQLLRTALRGRDAAGLRADLGRGAVDVAQLLPELRERLPEIPEPPQIEPEAARFRLFDAVTTLLKTLAERQPLMLVLDDLHWGDTPSLLLVQYLAQELRATPLLLLGTYRNVEVGRSTRWPLPWPSWPASRPTDA